MNNEIQKKYKAEITSQENEGLGVCKINDMVVFVENALVDETGEVLITELKKNYARGKMVSFDKISSDRQTPPCKYYGECGGCNLQHQTYKAQLKFKEYKVKNAMERIGGFKGLKINDIIFDEEFNYRNKVILRVSGSKIGFYKNNTNEVVDIDECLITDKKINECIKVIKSFIKNHSDNNIKSIMIRSGNGIMISIISKDTYFQKIMKEFLIEHIDNLKSLIFNDKVIYGNKYIEKEIDAFKFKVSDKSFFQVNDKIMNKLYDKVIEHVKDDNANTILDLYCGIGTITSKLSKYAKKVIGIEVVGEAVEDARENIELNNIDNIAFMVGKVEKQLPSLMDEDIDIIVVDPPRDGLDKEALNSIVKINPKKIIYVSCDPVTLARDLKLLSDSYDIKDLTPFDMFHNTSHVECVVLLKLK